MNSFSSNRSSFFLCMAAAGATTAAIWLTVKSKEKRTRRARYTCSCGKVEADIVVPAENYRYMEIPSFSCCCNDCVGFCQAVLQNGEVVDFLTPGAETLVMYDSEISLKSGKDQLKAMKLSSKTPNIRIYSTCCATPMGINMEGSGVTLLYTNNITSDKDETTNEVVPLPYVPPMVCFYGTGTSQKEGVKMANGRFAPRTIAHCIGRMALLALLGKKGPGEGFPVSSVDVGIGSIPQSFASVSTATE